MSLAGWLVGVVRQATLADYSMPNNIYYIHRFFLSLSLTLSLSLSLFLSLFLYIYIYSKSNVKLGGFRYQLQASYVCSQTEELRYNETVCLWFTIYTLPRGG